MTGTDRAGRLLDTPPSQTAHAPNDGHWLRQVLCAAAAAAATSFTTATPMDVQLTLDSLQVAHASIYHRRTCLYPRPPRFMVTRTITTIDAATKPRP